MTLKELQAEIIGAVARGWTHDKNASKQFDPELAKSIVSEVLPLITKAFKEGKKNERIRIYKKINKNIERGLN